MTPKIMIITLVVAFLTATTGTAYSLWGRGETFTVTFKDSKLLRPGAKVYLAGVDIGEVKAVELVGATVNVAIRLFPEQTGKIPRATMFFIDADKNNPKMKCILAKVSDRRGEPIIKGDVIEGTDSNLAWKLSEVADRIRDSIDSPQARRLLQDMEKFVDNFNESIQDTDWDQVGEEIHQQTQSLIEEIDRAMQSKEIQQSLEELERRIVIIQKALQAVEDSKEANQLQKALEALYSKLDKELRDAETQGRKTPESHADRWR